MSPFVKMAHDLLEKQAISRKLVDRVATKALQNESFRGIDRTGGFHAERAKRIKKSLSSPDLSPTQMRALANTEANHQRISEIANNLKAGRAKALTGSADQVAAALPHPHELSRLGGFELPHGTGKRLLVGGAAAALGLLAMKALAKRRETEDTYDQPY